MERINYRAHANFFCCRLGMLGFSTRFISEMTGLSYCKVLYRLRRTQIRRWDYRNGESKLAQFVVDKTKRATIESVKERIQPLLAEKTK